MENFQRIICIWICCTSCMFGHTQLTSNAVTAEAGPYEYFDDRDEYLYDLDSEQIQAKYDAHLLAQQIVKTEQQQEQQQLNNQHNLRQHKNDFEDSTTHHHHYQHHQHHQKQHQHHHHHHGDNQNVHDDEDDDYNNENGNENENDDIGIIVKDNIDAAHLSKDLPKTAAIKKSNNRYNNFKSLTDNGQYDTGMDTNFNDHDDGDDDGNDIVGNDTDVDVDLEPHERAASCYTAGQHYTHGQKVPRLDNCEVCLCMDGEIFCWWEKCDKRMNKPLKNDNIDYSSTPYATTNNKFLHQQLQHENKETSTKKPQLRERRIYDNDINSDDDNDNNENNSKEFFNLHEQQYHRNQKKLKKKQSRRQQLKQMNWKQKMQQQQQYNTPSSEHVHLQYHVSGGGGGVNGVNSKILNFPENLPAILYYDYKTEEHQHHQHLHHQQHLKRQQQKLRNKVQNLKHFNRYPSSSLSSSSASLLSHHVQQQRPQYTPTATSIQTMNSDAERKMTAYYAGDNNQRFSSQDETQAQNDGDIMPEPPPIKSKLPNVMKTLATQSTAIGLRVGGQSQSNLRDFNGIEHVKKNHVDNSLLKRNHKVFHHRSSQNINDMMTLDDKEIEENQKESVSNDNNNDDDDDDDYDRENEREDEAFHLWLTATEKNYSKTSGSGSNINTNGWKGNIIDLDIINATTTTQIPLNEILRTTTTTITLATPPTGLQSDSTFSALNINQNNNINSNNNNNNNGILYNPYNMALDFSQQQNSADEASTNSIVNIDITLTASPLMSEQHEDMEESFSLKQTPFLPKEAPVTNASFHLFNQESRVIANITATTTETTTISDNANSGGGNTNTNTNANNNNNNNFNPLQWRAFHLPLHQSETEAAAILTKEQHNDINDMEDKSYNFTPDARVSEYGTGGSRDDNNRTLLLIGLPERVNIPPPSYITTATATAKTSTIAPASATTLNPYRQCNVMGTFYKIGDILPQDTGNCLQCICIDGSTIDDTPRVTCSPHNCPPLVLPDLFDATGY